MEEKFTIQEVNKFIVVIKNNKQQDLVFDETEHWGCFY